MSRKWFLVATYSGAEWQAFNTLLDRGIPALYPRVIKSPRRGRWQQAQFAPQYPGYLFAGLDQGTSLETIKRVIGVKELVRNGNDVVIISPAEVSAFRKRWLKEWRQHLPRRRIITPILPGDTIAIPSGAFSGMPARIRTIDKSGFAVAQLGNLEVSFHVSALHQGVRDRPKALPTHSHTSQLSI